MNISKPNQKRKCKTNRVSETKKHEHLHVHVMGMRNNGSKKPAKCTSHATAIHSKQAQNERSPPHHTILKFKFGPPLSRARQCRSPCISVGPQNLTWDTGKDRANSVPRRTRGSAHRLGEN